MNSEEGMSMAKMAVTVLLVVLVIGAVVAIVYAAYNWFNSGKDKLANNVNGISDTSLAAYDNKDMTGSDVLSCMKNFSNSDYAVIVSNLKNQGGSYKEEASVGTNYCAQISTSAGKDTNNGLTVGSYLSGKLSDGFKAELNKKAGDFIRNSNLSPASDTSDVDHYVKPSAKWHCDLVKSASTGEIIGIYWRQKN